MSHKKARKEVELKQFFGDKHTVTVSSWPFPEPNKPIESQLGPTINGEIKVKPTEAVKFDEDKLDWTLLPFEALEDIVKVLEFGAKKYARDNWRNGNGLGIGRVTKSLMRHLFAYLRGEKNDPETGLSHWAHIGCNVLFVLYYLKHPDKFSQE